MKPTILAMQEWLKSCPLVADKLGDGVAFRIAYLGDKPSQFSIEDTPTDPVLKQYFNGSRRIKNYVLASRMEYTEDVWQQAANSGFWEELASWIEAQSEAENLPDLGPGRTAEAVAVTTTGYVFASQNDKCRFQIQIQLRYFQQKGALT